MLGIIKKAALAMAVIAAPLFASCSSVSGSSPEFLEAFHYSYYGSMPDRYAIQENQLNLFVDYSTCIAQAMNYDQTGSRFYQALVPSLTHETKHYFSIKGNDIHEEQGETFSLLRTVKEVNYADLATAVEMIANGNTEAVLLTDGEYYQQSIAMGNINNPYMTNAFKTWLKKGHDVYIFAEPYVETNRGRQFNKKRFYFIFTDSRISNNIFEVITNNVDIEQFPGVQYYHLTASNPRLMAVGEEACSIPNSMLGISPQPCGNFEIQDWTGWRWKDISSYIMNACDPNTGAPLQYGEPIITGLHLDKNFNGGCYRIEEISLEVKDINNEYVDFTNSLYEELANNNIYETDLNTVFPYAHSIAQIKRINPTDAKNFMLLDKDEFQSHGDIKILFDTPMFNGDFLCNKGYNYFMIELNVQSCSNNFSNNPLAQSIFEFDSIDFPGQMNTSVVESIKLAISDPAISNIVKGKTLYTIYVVCNKY